MDIKEQYFTCKKCGESKIWGEMTKHTRCKDGIRKLCNACRNNYLSESGSYAKTAITSHRWHEKNKMRGAASIKSWRASHKWEVSLQKKRWQSGQIARLGNQYCREKLKRKGFTREQIEQNPELINIQKTIIQMKRLCKTSNN